MSSACLRIVAVMTLVMLITQSGMLSMGVYCTVADHKAIEVCNLSYILPSIDYLWAFVIAFNGHHSIYCVLVLSLIVWKRVRNQDRYLLMMFPISTRIDSRKIKWMVFRLWFGFSLMVCAVIWMYGFSGRDLYVTVSEIVCTALNNLACWQLLSEDMCDVRITGMRTQEDHEEMEGIRNYDLDDVTNSEVERVRRCIKMACYGIIIHNVVYFVYDVTATPLRHGEDGRITPYQIQVNILFTLATVVYRITCAQYMFYVV